MQCTTLDEMKVSFNQLGLDAEQLDAFASQLDAMGKTIARNKLQLKRLESTYFSLPLKLKELLDNRKPNQDNLNNALTEYFEMHRRYDFRQCYTLFLNKIDEIKELRSKVMLNNHLIEQTMRAMDILYDQMVELATQNSEDATAFKEAFERFENLTAVFFANASQHRTPYHIRSA